MDAYAFGPHAPALAREIEQVAATA